ncbi:MAG: flagellar hook-associated protein FlgK [Leptospiraceae bacterium]|nr:flagellar hook-associated protein FlgK [Leptospiraceae bacterium]
MASTFMGLETAKRGMSSHQMALQTTGHNISNADNKNYARQRVQIETVMPLYNPSMNRENGPGMIGQGSKAGDIDRVRDKFIDSRIFNGEQSKSYWSTRENYLRQTEIIYNEPSDDSLRSQMDRFWQSWQELSQFPEEMSHREVVRTRGKEMTFRIRETFTRLFELRKQADFDIEVSVNRINELALQVRDLNERIMKSEALKDSPNDLKDRRDALIQELSQLGGVSIEFSDPNEAIVYLGGEMLVQGETVHKLLMANDAANEGLKKITWEHNDQLALFRSGRVQSLLDIRDQVLKENIEKMDLLAVNVSDIVNEVHRDGFGLTKETNVNFFDLENLSRNIRGNFDLTGNGQDDVSAVFKMAGRNKVVADRPIGVAGTLTFAKNDASSTSIYVTYRPDDTLSSVIERINRSGAGVVAYVNHNDNLVLKGKTAEDDWRTNFMIRHVEDSGELLVGFSGLLQNSGPAGAYDFRRLDEINKLQSGLERLTLTPVLHPAGAIQVSREVEGNIALIAAGFGKDVGGTGDVNQAFGMKDGGNALRIAQALRHKSTMVGEHRTADEFYNSLISKVGVETRTSKDQLENQSLILSNLENMRQSVMGVNLDEEMANMVQFQHAYNASARMLQMVNEMLDRIIGLVR